MKPFAIALSATLAMGLCLAHSHSDSSCRCPVTLLPIPSKKAAAAKSVYKGKTYYFCTTNCKRLFDKNPQKYLKHFK